MAKRGRQGRGKAVDSPWEKRKSQPGAAQGLSEVGTICSIPSGAAADPQAGSLTSTRCMKRVLDDAEMPNKVLFPSEKSAWFYINAWCTQP